jgi:hypothetical protein
MVGLTAGRATVLSVAAKATRGGMGRLSGMP